MPRKNLALEVALVVCVLAVAFIVQAVISQTKPLKPPKLPEFVGAERAVELPSNVDSVVEKELLEEPPRLKIPEKFDSNQSLLGVAPDWSVLDNYQSCVSKKEFEHLISKVYSVGDYWKHWFTIYDDYVLIRTTAAKPELSYKLTFKNDTLVGKPERYWRKKSEQGASNPSKPLLGLRIAIDPGHIGGNYAQIEERRFVLSEGVPPIQEGNMTLIVATQLIDQLEVLGATVSLIRDKNEPVNPFRPEDYFSYAKAKMNDRGQAVTEDSVRREATKLFYRNGEIRARALLVNYELKPDLVLCLHFNAAPQPDPENPVLLDDEHFHMILNGAYTQGEMAHDDERFKMVFKMVQGVHAEEATLAKYAASNLARESGLPAYQYAPNSSRAVNVDGNPYLWGRNLLANRMYDCPVLFFEPYLMNGKDSYTRMQMGDYGGLRYVNGKIRPSIYREYVDSVTKGLVEYYTQPEAVKVELKELETAE